MSNERADEFSGWAGKLDETGALDGLGLGMADKEAGWDRLYVRLGGPRQRRRRGVWWYWVAAASVLVAVLSGILLTNGHRGEGGLVVKGPEVKAVVSGGELKREVIVSKAEPVAPVVVRVVKKPELKPAVVAVVPVATGDSTVRVVEGAPSLPAAEPIAVASPFEKELKVISINEIQLPEDQQQKPGKFKIRFGNPGSYRPAMVTNQSAEKSGVYIKLSSQNQ